MGKLERQRTRQNRGGVFDPEKATLFETEPAPERPTLRSGVFSKGGASERNQGFAADAPKQDARAIHRIRLRAGENGTIKSMEAVRVSQRIVSSCFRRAGAPPLIVGEEQFWTGLGSDTPRGKASRVAKGEIEASRPSRQEAKSVISSQSSERTL